MSQLCRNGPGCINEANPFLECDGVGSSTKLKRKRRVKLSAAAEEDGGSFFVFDNLKDADLARGAARSGYCALFLKIASCIAYGEEFQKGSAGVGRVLAG